MKKNKYASYKIIEILSIYLFIYYFFIRVLYAYYDINVYLYRICFIVPLLVWFLLIIKVYIDNFNTIKYNKIINIFLFLFFYMSVYIIYYKFSGLDYIDNSAISYQIINLGYSVFNILLGIYIYNSLSIGKYKNIFFTLWLIYTFMLLVNLNEILLDRHNLGGVYLLLGDTYAVISIIGVFLLNQTKVIKIIFLSLVLFLLYAIGSRASFFSFLVVFLFFLSKEIGIKNLFYIIFAFSLLSYIVIYFDLLSVNKRMFGVFEGKSDGSLNERIEQFKYGIEAIKNNWFFGDFAGQNIVHQDGYRSGKMGAYMHNWLSYWRQYGLVFFLIFTFLYLYGMFKIFKKWLFNNNSLLNIIFYLVLFVGVELLLFRSYGNTLVYFVFPFMYMYLFYNHTMVIKSD